jgi:hypothetical protein
MYRESMLPWLTRGGGVGKEKCEEGEEQEEEKEV